MTVTDAEALGFLTVQEVAGRYRVSRSAIFGALRRGEIASVKVGGSRRIPFSEIDRLEREGGMR